MFLDKFIQEHMDANMAQEVNISMKIDVLAILRLTFWSKGVLRRSALWRWDVGHG